MFEVLVSQSLYHIQPKRIKWVKWVRLKLERNSNYPFLDEFEGTLVLGHLQQLHSTLLIGGKSTHLADKITRKLGMFGQLLKNNSNHFSMTG